MNFHEWAYDLNLLSDKADEIKKLDREKYGDCRSDIEVIEKVLHEKIEELGGISKHEYRGI